MIIGTETLPSNGFNDITTSQEDHEAIERSHDLCKKFYSVDAYNARFNNLSVSNLTVNNFNFNALIPLVSLLSVLGSTSLTSLIRSTIPFSSGPTSTSLSTTDGVVMGFGASATISLPLTITPTATRFAFTAPRSGTLANLTVSVDSVFSSTVTAGQTITFTFTVLQSRCANGTVSLPYATTSLTATASTIATATGVAQEGTTGCGGSSDSASLTIAKGDRITILVTADQPIITLIDAIAFSAGLEFSPSL